MVRPLRGGDERRQARRCRRGACGRDGRRRRGACGRAGRRRGRSRHDRSWDPGPGRPRLLSRRDPCDHRAAPARHQGRGGAAVRVVIADDSTLLREGLARLLSETGVEVTATVADAEALEDYLAGHEVDVAIVDIRMPPSYTHEGAEAAVRLRAAHPTLGMLL